MQLYTEQDFAATRRTLKNRFLTLAALLIVTLGVYTVFVTAVRHHTAAMAVMMVGMCVSYAFVTIKLIPWFRYWRYQVDMREGMSRETDAMFVSCSDSLRVSDGVAFHEFVVRVGDKEEDERLFFWDDDKQMPPLKEGQALHIRSFGNYITELTSADEQ